MARRTIVFAAICAVLAPAGVTTQTIVESLQLPDFGTEVEVTVVNIDVFVRDRDGLPVTGLTKEDFRILQNGVEMPISNFSAYSEGLRAAPPAQAAESPNRPSPVASTRAAYVLLYVDSEYIQPIHRTRTLENDLKIAVKLPNHRKYSVRYQRWIAQNPASDRIEGLLRSALGGAPGPNPMGLEVEVGVPPEVGAEVFRVPLDLVIPTGALTMKRRGDDWVGRIRLHVATRDDEGNEMDPWHRDHEIRIPEAEINDTHDAQYRLSLEFVIRNRYQIVAMAVVDLATSESSFVRTVLHRSD